MKEEKHGFKYHWNRIVKRKGFFPALYLVVAAVLLTGVLWYQNSNRISEPDLDLDFNLQDELWGEDALDSEDDVEPVAAPVENVMLPTLSESAAEIVTTFYDHEADEAEQEKALVFYNNKYYQSEGIDIVATNDQPLPVVAALSGEVVEVKLDPVVGHVVQIKHDHDLTTYYASLVDVEVEVGDQVAQGDVLAHAGSNLYSQDLGDHVHFEIRKSGQHLNPETVFEQPVTEISVEKDEDVAASSPYQVPDGSDQQLESSLSQARM